MPTYIEDLSGFEDLKGKFSHYSNVSTKVGVLSDEKYEGTEITIAGVASVNEFGSKDGHIPARPFMRTALRKQKTAITNLSRKLLEQTLKDTLSIPKAISSLGEFFTNKVQGSIIEFSIPPNAPATIKAKKGQDNPLINQGRLVQSITHNEVIE